MGGSIFRAVGINTMRLPADRALALASDILPALHEIERSANIPHTPAALIPAYRSKPDYGDLDFVISDHIVEALGDRFIANQLSERLGFDIMFRRPHAADPTLSLALTFRSGESFQVDLIRTSEELKDFALSFFSWNDTGSYIGRVARQMGLRYGQNGLMLLMSDTDGSRVPVSTDHDKVLDFLGFDPAVHRAGFDNPEAIYDFISSGRYFDPAIYEMDRMTNRARQRVKNRPFYPNFIEAMRQRPARYEWPAERAAGSRAVWLERLYEAFPGTREAHAAALEDFRRRTAACAFFNGKRVTALTGVSGPPLQHLMNAVRKEFDSPEAFLAWTERLDEADLKRRLSKAIKSGYLPEGYSA
ncbi:hypothetical protein [Erythrobacter aureus]|uniref:Uncharacterized protein n=1 Tax=Erythrobacter aureus TaxID=2182384 RepID=A0A345YJ29_9SPHN|nr:hypothetical protein [Erythrobacter aureus]AXK43931.1 hypothetical protein DVR09_15870 [Erythrobacter aureus]